LTTTEVGEWKQTVRETILKHPTVTLLHVKNCKSSFRLNFDPPTDDITDGFGTPSDYNLLPHGQKYSVEESIVLNVRRVNDDA
jgi:hypothetical protein